MIKANEAKKNTSIVRAKQQETLMKLAEQWLDETVSSAIEQASKSGLTFCDVSLARFDRYDEVLIFIGRTLEKNGYTVKRFAKSTNLQIRWDD
jgi:hypothetical protein